MAKYTSKEIAALGAKGQAMKNANGDWSYPIGDADDLDNAIHAVGRGGADHDAIRKYIIGVAKKLGLSSHIPDNWNADGSLSDADAQAPTGAQRRADGPTFNDIQSLVSSAVAATLPKDSTGEIPYVWICDLTDEWAVYQAESAAGLQQVPYSIGDDRTVTLGKPVPVVRITDYVPAGQETPDQAARAARLLHRAQPTAQDASVTAHLVAAHQAILQAKAAQMADPDNGSDPCDAQVLAHIEDACDALEEALKDQAMDQMPEAPATGSAAGPPTGDSGGMGGEPRSGRVPAVPRRAFGAGQTIAERAVPAGRVEVRMDSDPDGHTANFTGYASTTGTDYAVTDWLGEYRETIQPGAFAKTLREQTNVPLLVNHDGIPLASTGAGTSRLSEDAHGLRNDATLDRRQGLANDICVSLARGDLNKMSFSFRAVKDAWNNAYDERSVAELALYDTSIVTYPANPATSAELRSLMVDGIGREGQGIIWSLRAALGSVERRAAGLPEEAEPIVEQAIRALAAGDELLCRRTAGPHTRARTFLVAGLMEQVRKGAVLSAKNAKLLADAMDALAGAADGHQRAAESINAVLQDHQGANWSGLDGDQGGKSADGGPNPLDPGDGGGPRAARIPASVRKAQLDLLKMKGRG